MTNSTIAGEGIKRAKSRKRRWWAVFLGPAAVGIVLAGVARILWPNRVLPDGTLNPQFAIYAAAITVVGGLIAAVLYHRTIDEHEERAALLGMTVGFYLLALGTFAWFVLAAAKLVSLPSFLIVWFGCVIVAASVHVWKHHR